MKRLEEFKTKQTPLNQIFGGTRINTDTWFNGKKYCDYFIDANEDGRLSEGEVLHYGGVCAKKTSTVKSN